MIPNLRGAFLVAFLLLTPLVPQTYAQSGDMSGLVKSSIDAVVLIVVNDSNGKAVLEGSGFLVSSDGRIVTNHHVIAGASSAIVKLNNGAFFPVEGVIADDPERDLALIKVPGKGLPYLNLADSENFAVGQRVLAIGSPLGLENSVSDGIISALRTDEKGKSWIQTTAPASHGNSGGPLLVMDGKVIGVLTWKAGEGENLNFAAPSSSILPLLKNSAIQPLGSVLKTPVVPVAGRSERVWTSLVSGRDFKVRIDGDYIYTEWVNLPPVLQSTAAFLRSESKKEGDKWVGKVRSLMPYEIKTWAAQTVKWCSLESEFEIDKISESRIEGRSLNMPSIDVKKCKVTNSEWQSFTWIPK
jgi:Trypsin-like peptidase domain